MRESKGLDLIELILFVGITGRTRTWHPLAILTARRGSSAMQGVVAVMTGSSSVKTSSQRLMITTTRGGRHGSIEDLAFRKCPGMIILILLLRLCRSMPFLLML